MLICQTFICGYFTVAFTGAVAYFCSVWIRANSQSISEYLETVAEIYILKELSTWWTGAYVLVIGKFIFT